MGGKNKGNICNTFNKINLKKERKENWDEERLSELPKATQSLLHFPGFLPVPGELLRL